jgi:hypothetical protein
MLKKPIGALEWHGGQIHIYLHLSLYIYMVQGRLTRGSKKKKLLQKKKPVGATQWRGARARSRKRVGI